jgi:hypothetical protein
MKRIAFTMAVLALSAGAAFAASPAQTAATTAPAPKTHVATPMRDDMSAKRMTKALNLLEAKGYGAFNDFKANGQDYSAMVTQNGHSMTVLVDPDSGQVTTQS